MNRLKILGSALRGLGLEGEIISLGSYSGRRIDMLSYSRKILNLFFGWLSDEILRQGRAWEKLEESERYNIIDSGDGDKKIEEIFDDIYISISGDSRTGIGSVSGKVGGGGEVLIKEFDLSILGEEGKKLFLKADSHFRFKFFVAYSANKGGFREGGVAMGDGAIGYSRIISVDAETGYVGKNISNIYSGLLSTMVHEHTHIQQFLLAEELNDAKPGFMNKRFEEGGREDIVDLIDKNRLNMKDEDFFDEDESREYEDEEPDDAELTADEKIVKMIRLIDIMIKPNICPDLNEAAKIEGREIINSGEEYDIIHIASSRYFEECQKIREGVRDAEEADGKRSLKNRALSHHSNKKTKILKFVEYYNRQYEIEAHIRGWRAKLAIGKGNLMLKNLADYFNFNFKRFSEKEFPKAELVKLWDKYKETYRIMNYPEKYLGTDEEALSVKQKSRMQELFGM